MKKICFLMGAWVMSLLCACHSHEHGEEGHNHEAETAETASWSLEWFLANRSRYRMFVDMIIAFPGSILYNRACRSGAIPDPVRFLKDGCPIVNVSSMSDDEFDGLVSKIEKINGRIYNVKHYRRNEE